jgi:membrane fusion protein (multidrug efflux system)
MIKRMIIMLLLVALVLGGIFGYKIFAGMMMKKYMAAAGAPVQTVSSIKATSQDWQPRLDAVGTLRAVNGADLSPELAGVVESINFESGADVEAGTILVQMRAEDDIAKLHALEAASRIAAITYQRDVKQLKAQAVAQAVVDNDLATLDSAKAQVAEQQAIIDKKTIKAPFAGHLGIRQVDVGQYLNPGTPIVTLQQLDPIYVDFSSPEQSLSKFSLGQKVTLHTDANGDEDFNGEITALNSKIDDATRNIMVRATFKNPDHKLLPGMFGKVMIDTDKPVSYVTLPQTAIVFNPYGNTVYLVKNKKADAAEDDDENDDKKDQGGKIAVQTVVTTGETRGDQIAVLTGVKAGDVVVTSGQVKLRNGSPITINNEVQPANDANPQPHEQ